MGQKIYNRLNDGSVDKYVGGNQTNNYYISVSQDSEREFVVTHNANIKPVSYFTGRKMELQDLRQRIEEGRKSVLISGMGGIGKTHICRKLFEEYLNRHAEGRKEPFRYIGYIEYSGDMVSSLQSCLKFKQQDNPEQNKEAAWRELEYLASDGKMLLFVDNVDKPIEEDTGLERLKGIPGAVVLTSRQASLGDEFEPYQIGFLGMEQCKEIYEKIRFRGSGRKIDSDEVEDLTYIIESLVGRHTITVELLAHLARTKLWSVKRLKDELEKKGFRLTFRMDGEFVNIQESYEKLYDLSELTEVEQNILEAFSVFPYIFLAAETCNKWLLADTGASEDDDILMGLYQKGWLQFDVDQESYALHPVFAQFIYEKYRPAIKKHAGLIKALKYNLQIPESGSALMSQNYIPFAENICEKICVENALDQTDLIGTLAYSLLYITEYKKAGKLYEKLVKIYSDVFGENHPITAASYNDLAGMYQSQGVFEKAEELYEKSLRIYEKTQGESHLDTIRSYNNLAVVYAYQEKYEKAKEMFERSLLVRKKVLGEEHSDTANSYHNLAGAYADLGEYKKAEELYKKSLQIYEKVLGENHPDAVHGYSSLAYVYEKQGEYERAKELYEKSLKIRKSVFGKKHLAIATSYNDLAYLYVEQEEFQKACLYFIKAYRILYFKLGLEHSSTQVVYENMKFAFSKWNQERNFEYWLDEMMKE